ncbi:hypothetical protein CXB51_026158 [Gossypium anomalum]|uniref:Uncharacterized protein n=1 Tax=Gossypium anomalum TaxID=47600 RepID=A0A8J5Y2P5_9ROSI|nr:hypothetical protein CXB51_026158 [Gossypium anomalum]
MGNGSRDDIVKRSETLPFPEQNLNENIPSTSTQHQWVRHDNTPNSAEANSEQQTVVGSSNVPETLDKPAKFQTESGETRRGRGRTLLKDLYDLNPVERVKERFALEVSDDYIKKALGKKWRDNKITLKQQYFKKDISLEEREKLQNANVPPGMLRYQWEDADRKRVGTSSRQKQKFTHTAGSRSFASVDEAEKKLKEKKVEYETIASTDSSVNLENIDNRIITKFLGPERYSRVRFQGSSVTTIQYFGSGSQKYMPSESQAQAEV